MKSDFLIAVTQLAAERNLPREIVISAIEAALMSAYKKDSQTAGQNIKVKLDPGSGEVRIYIMKTVVETVTDSEKEVSLSAAKKINAEAAVGTDIAVNTIIHSAGRIAAQTAKQVVMQRLREAERDLIYAEFSDKAGEVLTGTVQRIEPRQVILDLGRAEAVLPTQEQVPNERCRAGQRLKVYLVEVRRSTKGPEIIVSRSHKDLLKRLFEVEVPEIFSGAVEIMAIAREAGSRSKVAVRARREGVDPVGSCVGLRGIRIQNIVNELQGEKIDVVEWNKEPNAFIANALSPAQVTRVELKKDEASALVVVPDRHLSLAIGREGQNARLAAKLTGWKIDIKSGTQAEEERLVKPAAGEKAVELPTIAERVAADVEKAVQDAVAKETVETVTKTPRKEPVSAGTAKVEPVVADVKEAAKPEKTLSPEEELASASLSEEPSKEGQGAEAEKALSLDEVPEEVWSVPVSRAREPGRLRFAEEIVGTKANKAAERKSQKGDKPEVPGQKVKRGGKRVRFHEQEDVE